MPDLLKYSHRLRITSDGERKFVFDPVRKKEVILTPEELLRQLVLLYLLEEKKYPAARIRVEMSLHIHGMIKRCDIVVFNRAAQPWLLVECKSPKVKLSQKTMEQSARYNLSLRVSFLAVTNGLKTYCCRMNYEEQTFQWMEDFPENEHI